MRQTCSFLQGQWGTSALNARLCCGELRCWAWIAASCQGRARVLLCHCAGPLVAPPAAVVGRAALDRVHTASPWRQHAAGGVAPSRQAVPLGLAPVAPTARARWASAQAACQHVVMSTPMDSVVVAYDTARVIGSRTS
jgi:hypothetical protein